MDVSRIRPEGKGARQAALPQGIYLVFVPIFIFDGLEDTVEKLKVYLYNETLHHLAMDYASFSKGALQFQMETELRAESEFYLHDISFEVASQNPVFDYRFTDVSNPKLDVEGSFTLKPKRFFDKIHEVKYQNKATFNFLLLENMTERPPIEVVKPEYLSTKFSPTSNNHFDFEHALKKSTYEVDLHIEKLFPAYQGLGASEILQIQLRECQKALDLAIATHQQALVLIHGVGRGTLKKEIHQLLDQTNWVKKYVHSYDSRYGYGATEVFFRY